MKKLSESLIDDVISRSRNDEARKEDDVNLLDRDGMCDYFKSHYEYLCDAPGIDKHYNGGDVLNICTLLYKDHYYRTYTRFDERGIERINQVLPIGLEKKSKEIFGDKLNGIKLNPLYNIMYKDGTISNQTLIDLIDRMIDMANENIDDDIRPLLKKRTS